MKNFRIYKILILGITPFLLYSCFVAKDYKAPEVVAEDATFRTDSASVDTTSMAEVSWKVFFTDQYLQDYIQKALKNNLDVKTAIQQITIAQSYLKQSKTGWVPTISAAFTAQHQERSKNSMMGSFLSGSSNQFQLSANLSWEVDIWGKIRSQKRAAQADYLYTVAAHRAVMTKLVSGLASTYYKLLAIDQQVKVTKETIEIREKSLETIKALHEAGNVTAVAVQQTKAQYYVAQELLLDLNYQKKVLENAFCILLGEAPHSVERATLNQQTIETELKIGVPALLLANRPDVMMAEEQYRKSFEMTNVARTGFYPSITLTAGGGFQSLQVQDLFSLNSLFANLVGGLMAPILNHRTIRTRYEVAQAQQKQALYSFESALLNASREVSNALYSYQTTTKKIDLEKKEYKAFKTAAEYSQSLLNNGLANYLEVLTAQESALNTKIQLINSKLSRLTSIVLLYQALGGGWR